MLVIHLWFSVFMAGAEATEGREIVGLEVTGLAVGPGFSVVTAKDGEELPVVIEVDVVPIVLVVAVEARRLDAASGVLIVVVGLVTTNTVLVVGRMED